MDTATVTYHSFTLTGEGFASIVRGLMLDDEPTRAWKLVVDSLVDPKNPSSKVKVEGVVRGILDGSRDLRGASDVGIRPVKSRKYIHVTGCHSDRRDDKVTVEYYKQRLAFLYAGRLRIDGRWCRPKAKVTIWSSDSGRYAARRFSRQDFDARTQLGYRQVWGKLRAEFHCGRHEHPETVVIDGVRTCVIFETCSEPPHWWSNCEQTPQGAVDDLLSVGRGLDERGHFTSYKTAAREMIDRDDLDGTHVADELREAADALDEEAYQERLLAIGERVREQAGGDTFALTLLDGRVLTVPRAPFVTWALDRVEGAELPKWTPISDPDLKMLNDSRVHSDWILGAQFDDGTGITFADMRTDNVSRPAYDELSRLQEEHHDRLTAQTRQYGGIFAALESLRGHASDVVEHPVAVIVDKGIRVGTVGQDVVVLPDLSPLRVNDIEGASTIIAETGGELSHLAIVARGVGLTVVLHPQARSTFTAGLHVTVDPKRRVVVVDSE